MVLYKRKPVRFEPLPPFLDDQTEIWAIEATGEVFTDYEKYLSRRDYYMQKQFTCESTGHQGYTFFEAQQSEMEASREINSIFPEALRSRVLEFVQFRNTARMDDLVNMVYDHFRDHYMVGDRVCVEHEGSRRHGIISQIQDTSRLHAIITNQNSDEQFRSYTYHITLDDSGEQVARYKASDLQRDRRVYSKLVLKQFLRSAVSREPWYGAPWSVKDYLAKKYNISTTVPEAKTRQSIMAAKKAAGPPNSNTPGTANTPDLPNGSHANPPATNGRGPHVGMPHHTTHGQTAFVNYSANTHPTFRPDQGRPPVPQFHDPPRMHPHMFPVPGQGRPPQFQPGVLPPPTIHNLPPHLAQIAQNMPPAGSGLPINLPFQNSFMQYQTLAPTAPPQAQPPTLSKPFEPVKYPIEDLKIKQPKTNVQRPPLKFFSDDVPEGAKPPENKTGILMKSIGPLLCAWETLNVHDTIYSLDSFTLDDFVDAMRYSSEEEECELLVEVHCAVLKQIVNDSGKLQAPLPRIEDSDESDEEGSSEETTPEREPSPPMRTTRSSLRKSEANALSKKRTPTPEPPKQIHKAAEFLAEYDWIEQCKIRNFREGGWQAMLVGVLYRLSFSPVQKDACDRVLAALVPADEDPSVESIARNYVHLDVNLRICALEMALQLTVATEAFREQLVAASQEMTRLRKEKIEHQKRRKELADELFKLDMERKIQLPANMPASPTEAKAVLDISMTDADDAKDETDVAAESADEPAAGNRKLRHTKNKRKRESESSKKEKAKKAKAEAAKTKQQKEWEALLEAIENKKEELRECEANINELDDDLRECLVHRSKVIGKDRFLNKYYWFEHNGMPFGGVPNSSTAEYGYANGRLWVQGPDEYELQPNLEEPALSADREEFGFTIPERKAKEEGETHLTKSTEWGYYDDPEDLDKILAWLDERGVREKALRKELIIFRDRIAEYMVKMKQHLAEEEKTKEEEEEGATRVSTRTKTYVDKEVTRPRCLRWTNSIMREELGYSHSEEYEPPKKSKRGTAKAVRGRGRK